MPGVCPLSSRGLAIRQCTLGSVSRGVTRLPVPEGLVEAVGGIAARNTDLNLGQEGSGLGRS